MWAVLGTALFYLPVNVKYLNFKIRIMSNDTELADIEEVSVTEFFEHEEQDFTPWLADNIDYLTQKDILNIPLDVQQTEAPIGRYWADIIAEDPEGDRTVIIENQFGGTDHSHLGQSLVYSAGKNADVVVWIAEEFTDEHLSAFRWLNNRTDKEASFFAVEVSLQRIQDSPYAIEFNTLERPDAWREQVNKENLSSTQREQQQFWNKFIEYANEQDLSRFVSRQPSTRASYAISIGHGNTYIRPTARFSTDELIAMIRFKNKNKDFDGVNQQAFEETLEEAVREINPSNFTSNVADSIEWDRANEGQSYDHVYLHREDVHFDDTSSWEAYFEWLLEATQLYEYSLNEVLD